MIIGSAHVRISFVIIGFYQYESCTPANITIGEVIFFPPNDFPDKSETSHSFEHITIVALDPGLIWLIAFTQISGDMATEHINGNGPEEPMDTSAVTHSEHFQTLLEAGLPQKVAEKLDEIYLAGKAL